MHPKGHAVTPICPQCDEPGLHASVDDCLIALHRAYQALAACLLRIRTPTQ